MNPTLKFIVCGLEHSGTTMVSDLFREHPQVESGFECGVLLCERPKDFLTFEPFCNHMQVGWKINQNDFSYACEASDFISFYQRLFERSGVVKDNNPSTIFDKTPRYITQLVTVQSRLNLPIIAIIKDPRSLALSDFKRSKQSTEMIDQWYEEWKKSKIAYMRSAYEGYQYAWKDPNCLVVKLEDICFDAKNTVKSMFEFVDIKFRTEFLNLRHKRFNNTSGSSINVNSCMQFMDVLPISLQQKILRDFSEFDQWFYPF